MSNPLGEGAPFTQVEQDGTAETLTYALPNAGRFDVDSVVATIDNSGGPDIHPILYLAAPNGEIIAKKVQSEIIPAGDSGSATWALRLDDSGASSPAAAATVMAVAYRDHFNVPVTNASSFADFAPWDYLDTSGGDIDLNAGGEVRVNTPGLYLTMVNLQVFDNTWAAAVRISLNYVLGIGGLGNSIVQTSPGNFTDIQAITDAFGGKEWFLSQFEYVNIQTVPETLLPSAFLISGIAGHVATRTFASMSVQRVGPAPNMALD